MAKQLNVNVAVTADTSAAKAQLQELQTSLQQLSTSSTNLHLGLNTSELNKAIADVDKLQAHLKNATNSSGMLDFSKLNNSIKASGSSLTEYGNQLLKLGPQGQQAFNQLTQAVAKSTVPMSRMKGILGEFGTVLGNTIKWQAASSAIHGMMGSIQHAFSYAEQLNKSLNNIQIVTQNSDAQMARFAESANKAAKQLNTTTTSYTNASLIYYQQGLSEKEVAARTETTIKMANASGQSAEKVSDQMTAIWNNFAKGGENLEHYADVITALGAATASSSTEIATGLQKFASVADTVGLSYENATAALATITATTRQSADSVGTGLRTLFARLQSLNLGETLDDGVTLSKYSKALDTIGVKVLDYAGNLRSADDILEDMGNKWQDLSSAQKTAVAQTVGGVRQYTTIMALMDNFDFYKQNQKIAANADGTVQAQADIYAKSWEAAQKRVKASAESIYSDLINDDFFISLNDGLAGFLNLLDQVIDGMGGLKTLLPMIGAAMTAAFSDKATLGLMNLSNNLKMLAPGAAKRDRAERDAFLNQALKVQTGYDSKNYKNLSSDQKLQYDYAKRDLEFQRAYANNSRYMTSLDQMVAQSAMDKYSNLRNAYMQNQQKIAASRQDISEKRSNMIGLNSTSLNPYLNRSQLDSTGKRQFAGAQEFELMRQGALAQGQEKPTYFTDKSNQSGQWFSNNGAFLKTVYDTALQRSGDVGTLTKGIDSRQDEINILKHLQDTGYAGLSSAVKDFKTLSGGTRGTKDILESLRTKGILDSSNQTINQDALQDEISTITKEQDQMVTDFAAKWGKSKEAVMKYKDAIVATNGDVEKQKELKQQMEQADEAAAKATQKNQQVQRAQNIVKYAQAMQGAVAAGQSFAAVTQNINNNLENGGSIFDNFGATLSGATSGFMSMAMTMAAIPGPAGIALAAISAIIGVASQIPGVQKFFHELFHTEDELALEKMQAASENIGTSLEETKEKAKQFLEATDTHNGLLEKINECTKGTNEFKEAVAQANAYAKQMINDFNLSLSDFTVDKNGAFVLDEKVAEAKKTEYENQIQNLEAAQNYLDNYVIPQQESKMARDKANKFGNAQLHTSNEYGASKGAMGLWFTGENEEGFWGYDPDRGTKLNDLLNDYIEHGLEVGANTFQEYVDGYTGGTGSQTSKYDNFIKEIEDATHQTIEEYVNNQREYGTQEAQRLGQDKLLKSYFDNAVLNQVFNNEDLNKNIASFVGQNMSNGNNYSKLGFNQAVKDRAVITDQNRESVITAMAKAYNQDPDALRKDNELLQALAEAYHARILTEQEFEKEYAEVQDADNKLRAKIVSSTKDKDKNEIGNLNQTEQNDIRDWLVEQIEANKETNQLLSDYYQSVLDNYDNIKQAQIDGLAEVLSRPDDLSKTGNEVVQKYLKDFISNLNIDDATLNEVTDLVNNINKLFNSDKLNLNMKALFENLFDGQEIDKAMQQAWRSVDFSSKIASLVDIKDIANGFGAGSNKEIANYFGDLYDTLFESFGGKSGVLSQIFENADFQKELKKVQKQFKKTGKIGSDSIEDLSDASEDFADLLNSDVFDSVEAVADAIELYSMGAIDSIADIEDELWNALDAANSMAEEIRKAFEFIDNFKPDRSISDLGGFFGDTYKDQQKELGQGTVGSARLYQETAALWGGAGTRMDGAGDAAGQIYADKMREFFLDLERKGITGEAAQDAYKARYGQFDEVMAQVAKEGNLGAYWNFMTNQENAGVLTSMFGGYKTAEGKTLSIPDALKQELGITANKDGTIDISGKGTKNGPGTTTKEFTKALADIMGYSEEEASVFAEELIGHSAGLSNDLRIADAISGLDSIKDPAQRELFTKANRSALGMARDEHDNIRQKIKNQAGVAMGTLDQTVQEAGYELNQEGYTEWAKSLGVLTDAEAERFGYIRSHIKDINEAITAEAQLSEARKKANKNAEEYINGNKDKDITEGMTTQERAALTKSATIGTDENGNNIFDADKLIDGATESEEAFEAAKKAASDLGGTIGTKVGDQFVQASGDLEQFNEQIKAAEEVLQRQQNEQLGQDLFKGVIDSIQELVENGKLDQLGEAAQPLLDFMSSLATLGAGDTAGNIETVQEKLGELIGSLGNIEDPAGGLSSLKEALEQLDQYMNTESEQGNQIKLSATWADGFDPSSLISKLNGEGNGIPIPVDKSEIENAITELSQNLQDVEVKVTTPGAAAALQATKDISQNIEQLSEPKTITITLGGTAGSDINTIQEKADTLKTTLEQAGYSVTIKDEGTGTIDVVIQKAEGLTDAIKDVPLSIDPGDSEGTIQKILDLIQDQTITVTVKYVDENNNEISISSLTTPPSSETPVVTETPPSSVVPKASQPSTYTKADAYSELNKAIMTAVTSRMGEQSALDVNDWIQGNKPSLPIFDEILTDLYKTLGGDMEKWDSSTNKDLYDAMIDIMTKDQSGEGETPQASVDIESPKQNAEAGYKSEREEENQDAEYERKAAEGPRSPMTGEEITSTLNLDTSEAENALNNLQTNVEQTGDIQPSVGSFSGTAAEIEQISTALQEIQSVGSLNVNIAVNPSMSAEEIHHLADDFEDMASKYNNIDVTINVPEDGYEKVKRLKNEFNELEDTLNRINGNKVGEDLIPDDMSLKDLLGDIKDHVPDSDSSAFGERKKDKEHATGQVVRRVGDEYEEDVDLQEDKQSTLQTQPMGMMPSMGLADGATESLQALGEVDVSDATSSIQELSGALAEVSSSAEEAASSLNNFKTAASSVKSAASQAASGLKQLSKVDLSNLDQAAESLETFNETIEDMSKGGDIAINATVEVDTSDLEQAQQSIDAMSEEVINVNANSTQLDEAIGKLDTIKSYNPILINVNANYTQVEMAISRVRALDAMSASIPVSVQVSVSGASTGGYVGAGYAGGGLTGAVGGVGLKEVKANPAVRRAIDEIVKHMAPKEVVNGGGGSVKWGDWQWGSHAGGGYIMQSFVNGSANHRAMPGPSLVAEEGPEIIWNKQEGYAYITGGHGHAEFTMLHPGDRIFNANETREILNYSEPDSNYSSIVRDPKEMEFLSADGLFGSHAAGTAYNSYGSQSTYGGGHGGRGSAGKGKRNAKRKDYTPERYHLITRQVQDLTFWYQELEKAREAAYGVNVLEAIEKEIKATKELTSANREYLDEIEDYIAKDKAHLIAEIPWVTFDDKGNVKNFEDIQEKWGEEAAGAGPRIEALQKSEDESAQDMIDAIIEEAKRKMNAVSQYEETLDKWQEIYEEFTDLLYQEAELHLEKITAEVEMEIKFEDTDVDILQHYLDKIEDNAYAIGDALNIVTKQIDLTAQKIDTIKDGIEATFQEMRGENANQVLVQGSNGQFTMTEGENPVVKTDWEEEIRDYIKAHRIEYEKSHPGITAVEAEEAVRQMFIEENNLRTLTADEYMDLALQGYNFHIHGSFGEALEENLNDLLDTIEDLDEYRFYAAERLADGYEKLADDVGYQLDLFDQFANTLETVQNITELQGIRMPQTVKQIMKDLNQALIDNNKNVINSQKAQLAELTNTAMQLQNLLASATDERLKQMYKEQLQDVEDSIADAQDSLLSALNDGLSTARDMFDASMEEITAAYERAISAMYGTTSNLSDAIDRKQDLADQYVDDYEKFYQLTRLERTINRDIDDRVNKGIKNNRRLEAILQEINGIRATGQKMSEAELDVLQKRYDIAKAEADLEDARTAKQTVRLQRDRNGNWGYVYTAIDDDQTADLEQARDDAIYEYQKALTASMNDIASRLQELINEYQQQNADIYQQFIDGTITEEEMQKAIADLDEWYTSQSRYFESQFVKFQGMANDTIERAKLLYSTSSFDILDKFGETVEAQVNNVNHIIEMTNNAYTATLAFRDVAKQAIDDYEAAVVDLDKTLNESMDSLDNYADWANTVRDAVIDQSKDTSNAVRHLSEDLTLWVNDAVGEINRFQNSYTQRMDPVIDSTETFINRLATALGYMNGINTALETFADTKTAVDQAVGMDVNMNSAPNQASQLLEQNDFIREQRQVENMYQNEEDRLKAAQQQIQQDQLAYYLKILDLQSQIQYAGLGGLIHNPYDSSNMNINNEGDTLEQQITITANFPNATNHSEIELALNNFVNQATQYVNRNNIAEVG